MKDKPSPRLIDRELRQKINTLEDEVTHISNVQTPLAHLQELVDNLIAHTRMHPSDKCRQNNPFGEEDEVADKD